MKSNEIPHLYIHVYTLLLDKVKKKNPSSGVVYEIRFGLRGGERFLRVFFFTPSSFCAPDFTYFIIFFFSRFFTSTSSRRRRRCAHIAFARGLVSPDWTSIHVIRTRLYTRLGT